jgi:hypothetical protein
MTTLLKSIGKHPNSSDNIQRHLTCLALTELDAHVEITQSAPYSKELAINSVCANALMNLAAIKTHR